MVEASGGSGFFVVVGGGGVGAGFRRGVLIRCVTFDCFGRQLHPFRELYRPCAY